MIHAYEGEEQYGWLPRLTIKHYDGTLVLGAEMDQNYSDHWASIDWARIYLQMFRQITVTTSGMLAPMSQLHTDMNYYDIDPKLTLMFDLEYAFNQYKFYGEKFVGNMFMIPYHFFNPRIGLNYNVTRVSNFYFNVSRTSRKPQLEDIYNADESSSGETPRFAMNPDSTLNFGEPLMKPETLNDFELGFRFDNKTLSLGVTAYWMEFYNELVDNGLLINMDNRLTDNADRTRHIGLEFEGNTNLTNEFSIYGNLTVQQKPFDPLQEPQRH